jgi:hypothetical protein
MRLQEGEDNRAKNDIIGELTFYELVMILRTEFHRKSKAALDLDKLHRDILDCICAFANCSHGTVRMS